MSLWAAYLLDWLVALSAFGCGIGLEYVSPFEQKIIYDASISYPYKKGEIIPTYLLNILAVFAPAIVLFLYQYFIKKLTLRKIHPTLLGLFLCISLTYLASNLIKLAVGRARPDFLDRCRPVDIHAAFMTCQGKHSLVRDGRKSFPSGHASYSFAGLGYLGLFLLGHLKIQSIGGRSIKLITVGVPFLVALLIGISRIDDYRHHWQDVLAGNVLGLAIAYATYRQYYPCPTDPNSDTLRSHRAATEPGASLSLGSRESGIDNEAALSAKSKEADANV